MQNTTGDPKDSASGEVPARKLSLRQRVLRVSRIKGKHTYVIFGKPAKVLSEGSRYLKHRDELDRQRHEQATSRDKSTPARKFSLRQRIFRVSRIKDKHTYVIFGKPATALSRRSQYLRNRDLMDDFRQQVVAARRVASQQEQKDKKKGKGKEKRSADNTLTGIERPPYYHKKGRLERPSVDELCAELARYDVVSFDIFDTALMRVVEHPNHVFRIMSAKTGVGNFTQIRKNAEGHIRFVSDRQRGTREVTLAEIYAVLVERYGADPAWEQMEMELEVELSRPNPYIKEAYDRLREMGKTLVFMSDMYLPLDTIKKMLAANGYHGYDKIFLSNELMQRKGDGTLQMTLLDDYEGRSVIHIGDVFESDVKKSLAAGLPALHNPDQREFNRENDMDSLAGSFYGAVINNTMGVGLWDKGLHYTHGYRVGGILTVGYTEYLERLAREKNIDKILFCGRDCDIIFRAYQKIFGTGTSTYIDISRYAVTGITLDRNFGDYIGRSFLRWFDESKNAHTVEQLLMETGFDYLVPYLEDADIERFLFPQSANRRRLEQFMWDHKHVVEAHNASGVEAAKQYFSEAVGDAKRVLVVDVGWSGTCASALRHFFRTVMPERGIDVFGALMCTSRDDALTGLVSEGFSSAYIYSPLANMDLTRFMMPGGRHPIRVTDLLHLPLEYMFTEAQPTVTGYAFDEDGKAVVTRGNNQPDNAEQILEMQQGILDFIEAYLEYSAPYRAIRPISSYVAFNPLKNAIGHKDYCYEVYKDFHYDATPALFGERLVVERFGDLFERPEASVVISASETPSRRILFISPEMLYAGAPRSLLRMCKVAASLGYEPIVWTAKAGPFAKEFESLGFPVRVESANSLTAETVKNLIASGVQLVVCNTIVTDAYVRALEGRIPVVWYVREATNLPDFFRTSPERLETLRHSQSICCVSDYAATAIAKYARGPIQVVHNSVEDVSSLAAEYTFRSGGKHKFIQLGTIEQRKGYDLFVTAYKAMPEEYRARSELHFAGGFINSGASFSSYLFGQIEGEEGIHYHGLISDERHKIELLSQMDTVVVASRDESCSLVALEGTMLSKPLIVTTNVGANYMVGEENGLIVESGSVAALRDAFMDMIDRDERASREMGAASRVRYENLASMNSYRRDLRNLFHERVIDGPLSPLPVESTHESDSVSTTAIPRPRLIVSMTSFPDRISTIAPCIDSLLTQTRPADQFILWLSTDQFPGEELDLPADVMSKVGARFQIEWVSGDIGPHKKYYYAMRAFPDDLVVTVDDDVIYHDRLLEYLYEGHQENPHAVIAERANLMLFKPSGQLREYDGWIYDCQFLRGTTSYQLLPTGIGGVLYPPHSLPPEAFDLDAFMELAPRADDLWLKAMTAANGYPVWMPRRRSGYRPIEEAQAVGLWRSNSFHGQNDAALHRVLGYMDEEFGLDGGLLKRIQGIGAHGEVVGSEIELTSIIPAGEKTGSSQPGRRAEGLQIRKSPNGIQPIGDGVTVSSTQYSLTAR